MKSQATKLTQLQLAYLAYWEARGAVFGRDEAIPESTCIPPSNRTCRLDFILSAVGVVVFIGLMWWVK